MPATRRQASKNPGHRAPGTLVLFRPGRPARACGRRSGSVSSGDVTMKSHRILRPVLGALTLVVAGCAWDGPRSTLVPRSDFAQAIADVYWVITAAAVGIALVVAVLLAWVLARYRARPGAPEPRQIRGHTLLEIGWTVAP